MARIDAVHVRCPTTSMDFHQISIRFWHKIDETIWFPSVSKSSKTRGGGVKLGAAAAGAGAAAAAAAAPAPFKSSRQKKLHKLLKISQDHPARSGIRQNLARSRCKCCIVLHSAARFCKYKPNLSKTEILSRWCEAVQSQHWWARYGATWENMDFDRGHMKKAKWCKMMPKMMQMMPKMMQMIANCGSLQPDVATCCNMLQRSKSDFKPNSSSLASASTRPWAPDGTNPPRSSHKTHKTHKTHKRHTWHITYI